MFQKILREVNQEYISYIHEWRCIVSECGTPYPVQSHHYITRGARGSDLTCLPCCAIHHYEIHKIGRYTFQKKYKLNCEELIKQYNTFFENGIKGPFHEEVQALKKRGRKFNAS